VLIGLAKRIEKRGVTANQVTLVGLLVMFPAAIAILNGRFFVAAMLMGVSGFLDLLDGKIARLQSQKSSFGALLDSAVDRYTDSIYLLAIGVYFLYVGRAGFMILAMVALVGSFQISYVKARAEGLGQQCKVGFWQRPERMILVMVALLVNNLALAVVYLAIATQLTAVERILNTKYQMEGGQWPSWFRKLLFLRFTRASLAYRTKAVMIILTLMFIRL